MGAAFITVLLFGIALGLLFGNVTTTISVWTSGMYTPAQKSWQTVLLWLVPGSFLLVRWFVSPPPPPIIRDSAWRDDRAIEWAGSETHNEPQMHHSHHVD